LRAWEQVRRVGQGKADEGIISYKDIVKEKDYIGVNRG
jgi:hypothetical protein